MHSVPVPIEVRCYSNSDIIVRRSEVTPRAKLRSRESHASAIQSRFARKNRLIKDDLTSCNHDAFIALTGKRLCSRPVNSSVAIAE